MKNACDIRTPKKVFAWVLACGCALSAVAAEDPQGALRGGTWKVEYASATGPQGRALQVITERLGSVLLREDFTSHALVLPLEKVGGGARVEKRDAMVVGVPSENPRLAAFVRPGDVPKGGYLIETVHRDGRNYVVLAGDGPREVLWATFDFFDVMLPEMGPALSGPHNRYNGSFFRKDQVPYRRRVTAPATAVRSVFAWGHVVDDYRGFFREMARARFTRAVLWSNRPVVNAHDVVSCAHDWGIEVFWGFSWGWSTDCTKADLTDLKKLGNDIFADWKRLWQPMGGDGIYFQSFTENVEGEMCGKSVPEAVTELVNDVAARIRADAPGTPIVFGLHADAMRKTGMMAAFKKVDPSVEILWENCGAFPFWEAELPIACSDVAFSEQILADYPNSGFAWKAQLRQDWKNWPAPCGPYLLGCAGAKVYAHDRAVLEPMLVAFDEDWVLNGRVARELLRQLRKGPNAPRELNAVAEYNPPFAFATQCQAELFWGSDDTWEDVSRRARLRARPEPSADHHSSLVP